MSDADAISVESQPVAETPAAVLPEPVSTAAPATDPPSAAEQPAAEAGQLVQGLKTLRDALTLLLDRAERNDRYHVFAVPDAADPFLVSCDTLQELVVRLRELHSQQVLICPFLGMPLQITSQSHCLVTDQGTFPLAAAEEVDSPSPWVSFGVPLHADLAPVEGIAITGPAAEDAEAEEDEDEDEDEVLGG